ncbi:MAG: hypothetical protein NTZ16_12220, partial [Verrucomicrobia bacterium]|nr:hypothetical protein [Verrucomicrobiota bacterium]
RSRHCCATRESWLLQLRHTRRSARHFMQTSPRPGQPELHFPAPFRGRMLQGFPLGVSSSQIRARVRAGLPVDSLVPAAVAEAIRGAGLYRG